MGKKILLIFLVSGLLIACSSPENEEYIDYANLETLPTQEILEISENENFLPGRLEGVIVDSEGDILVSDWANRNIVRFSSDGEYLSTVAEGGEGPGEIGRYIQMQQLRNDTLLVRSQSLERDYFVKEGSGEYDFVRSFMPERSSFFRKEILGPKTDTTYYAKVTTTMRNMQQAAKNQNEYENKVLAEINPNGAIVEDSLLLLKEGTRHISETARGYRMQQVPYRYDDHFVSLDDGILIARPDSNAFYIYSNEVQLERRIPFNVKPRPVTEEDLDYQLGDLDDDLRSELEELIDDEKPPYLDVWVTNRRIWLKTRVGEEGKQVVVLDFEGEPVGKLMLPKIDQIETVRDNYIYTIHKDPKQGNTVRKYEVEI